MAISESSITDVVLTNTFEEWRSKTNQLITVINENLDDDPVTSLLSADSQGGLTINTISADIVTGANVTGTRLLFSGSPEINFTGATVTDLGTSAKFALVEDSGATITGSSPDSKIERAQINQCEINLNGANLNANSPGAGGTSTINFNGATISDLGTVSVATFNGGTINNMNVNITDASTAQFITVSAAGPHIFTGASFNYGTYNNPTTIGGITHSANISINASSAFVANVGAIFGSDVASANVAIGDFPEYTHLTGPKLPTSSKGRLHIRSDFALPGTETPTAVEAVADELVLENENFVGMTLLSDTASNAHIMFGDTDDQKRGSIIYDHDTDSMLVVTDGANTAVFANEYGGSLQIVGGDTYSAAGQAGKLHVNVGSTDGITGMYLDSNDVDQRAIKIDASQTTMNVFEIVADTFTTGHVLSIRRNLDSNYANGSLIHLTDDNASTNVRAIIDIVQENSSASGTVGLKIKTDGGTGISVVQNASGAKAGISVEQNAPHHGISVVQNTDKPGINVWSSQAHTEALGKFHSTSASATGPSLYVHGSGSGATKVLHVANSAGDIFSARANGVTYCHRIECGAFLTAEHPTSAIHLLGVRDTGGTVVNLS